MRRVPPTFRRGVPALLLACALAACGASDDAGPAAPTTDPVAGGVVATAPATTTAALTQTTTATAPPTTTAPTTTVTSVPATTVAPTTAPPTTVAPTTAPPTTAPSTTSPPAPPPTVPPYSSWTLDLTAPTLTLGHSIQGRPIVAERFGQGGRRVLVIGVIHGNEDDGVAIVDQLRARAVGGTAPLDEVELWLVESMNPDGQAAQIRQNAGQVDLNRNFPYKWGPIGEPGNSQYAGIGPASEPETQAMVNFIEQLRPDIAIWYHQDANLVIPSTGRDGRVRARYAELTELPIADCCGGGGVYTGIAATWARNELKQDSDAVPFIVELPGSLTPEQVTAHTDAVLTIATEG